MSHVSPAFAPVFGDCLRYLRKLLYTEKGQPFIIAGSGTLGWDLVAANCASDLPFVSFAYGRRKSEVLTFVCRAVLEAGQKALVLNTGYFGDA